jgi:hypothetical protein
MEIEGGISGGVSAFRTIEEVDHNNAVLANTLRQPPFAPPPSPQELVARAAEKTANTLRSAILMSPERGQVEATAAVMAEALLDFAGNLRVDGNLRANTLNPPK